MKLIAACGPLNIDDSQPAIIFLQHEDCPSDNAVAKLILPLENAAMKARLTIDGAECVVLSNLLRDKLDLAWWQLEG